MLFCTLSLFNLQQIPRACHVKGIQYYFFAKSDLDLSIDFFFVFILYLSNYSFTKYIMFYPIITTLDGGGGSGQE